MSLDILAHIFLDLNKLANFLLFVFVVFTIIRIHIIIKILEYLRKEFNSFYLDLNPNNSIKMFFMTGRSLFFGFNYLLSERYILDDYLKGKKSLLYFVTVFRIIVFILLIALLIKIKIIILKNFF